MRDGDGETDAGEEVAGGVRVPMPRHSFSLQKARSRGPEPPGHGRDNGCGALGGEEVAQVICVVGFVGDELAQRGDAGQQRPAADDIVRLAGGEHQGVTATLAVAERVDLGGAARSGGADRLAPNGRTRKW